MAKGKKSGAPASEKLETPTVGLGAAYAAWERGDMVTARELAQGVLSGQPAGDEKHVKRVAKLLLNDEAALPEAVAAELSTRTEVPPRTYLFPAAAASVLLLLLTLARLRYS